MLPLEMQNGSGKVVEKSIETLSFVKDGHGLSEKSVTVHFDPQLYCMSEDEETRENIERLWIERTMQNSRWESNTDFFQLL